MDNDRAASLDVEHPDLQQQEKHAGFFGLFTRRRFGPGDIILDLREADILPAPDYRTIDLLDTHVVHPVGQYVNHSCAPSALVDRARRALVALVPIDVGDEITFDYLANERVVVAPFDCRCGAVNCVGRVETKADPSSIGALT